MGPKSPLPRDPALDGTLSLMREGYAWAGRRCERLGTQEFRTRLLGRAAVCWRGVEAAEAFQDPGRFTGRATLARLGVELPGHDGIPERKAGEGRARELLSPPQVSRLVDVFTRRWRKAVPDWRDRGQIAFHDEMCLLLATSSAEWAGVPIRHGERLARTRELAARDATPAAAWIRERVAARGRRRAHAPPGSVAETLIGSGAREEDVVAALLELIRPTVAVARYLAFTVLALHGHPSWREICAGGDARALRAFAREVRRYYPFAPPVARRVKQPFERHGHRYGAGEWVLLDVYGTDHDGHYWKAADLFDPRRFLDGGGGGRDTLEAWHRCPGEELTVELIAAAARLLSTGSHWDLPHQDLSIPLDRIPTLPRSGVIVSFYSDDGAPPMGPHAAG